MASPDPFLHKDPSMPHPLPNPGPSPRLRDPQPDWIEMIRTALQGLEPLTPPLERWFDRMEDAR